MRGEKKLIELYFILPRECPGAALHDDDGEWVAIDDVTGQELDPKMMKAARMDEIAYFKKMGVYEKVDISEAPNTAEHHHGGPRGFHEPRHDRGNPDRARRFDDHLGALEQNQYGAGGFVIVNGDYLIDGVLDDLEVQLTRLCHRNTVGNRGLNRDLDDFSRFQRTGIRGGILCLNTDDLEGSTFCGSALLHGASDT